MKKYFLILLILIFCTSCGFKIVKTDDIYQIAEKTGSVELDGDDNNAVDVSLGGTNGTTAAAGATGLGLGTSNDVTFNSVTINRSATPTASAGDSDCTDDDTNWQQVINATDTGSGTEDIDLTEKIQINGTLTTIRVVNADSHYEIGSALMPVFTYIYTASYGSNQTLTVDECKGGQIYVTGAGTITLPAIFNGGSVSICTIGDIAVSVDVNALDKMYLDGSALDDGDKITNTSTSGDCAVLIYYSADGWYASTNSWTDGGP